jgi:hypothetical protein
MGKRMIFLCKMVFFLLVPMGAIAATGEELWLVQQEFVRFGKKDLYEEWKMQWLNKWRIYEGRKLPVLTIEDSEGSQFLYLVPVQNYDELGRYFQRQKKFLDSMDVFLQKNYAALTSSTLNFRIFSLHHYLPDCSYIPKGTNCAIDKLPKIKYMMCSVTPGNEVAFESYLEKAVFSNQKRQSSVCWRSWKVIFGGDVPKYIIAFFAADEDSLSKAPELLDSKIKDIVLRLKEGKGSFRKDLSIMP